MSIFDDLFGNIGDSISESIGGLVNSGTRNIFEELFGGFDTGDLATSGIATELFEDLYEQARDLNLTVPEFIQVQPQLAQQTLVNSGIGQFIPENLVLERLQSLPAVELEGYVAQELGTTDFGTDLQGFDPATQDSIGFTGDLEGFDAITPDAASLITEDPALRNQILESTGMLQELVDQGGFGLEDQQVNNLLLDEQARQSQRLQEGALDEMRARGAAGGGQELAARMLANQLASEEGRRSGIELGREARDRSLAAQGQLAGQLQGVRGQDLDVASQNQAALNRFNEFVSGLQTQAEESKADARNTQLLEEFASANQAAQANASRTQDARQFAATVANQQAIAEFENATEVARANQAAINEARRFAADQETRERLTNLEQENEQLIRNLEVANREALTNFEAQNKAGEFNADAARRIAEINADIQNRASEINAGIINSTNQFNADQRLQVEQAGNKARLDRFNQVQESGGALADQLNAEEASAARNEANQRILEQLGGGRVSDPLQGLGDQTGGGGLIGDLFDGLFGGGNQGTGGFNPNAPGPQTGSGGGFFDDILDGLGGVIGLDPQGDGTIIDDIFGGIGDLFGGTQPSGNQNILPQDVFGREIFGFDADTAPTPPAGARDDGFIPSTGTGGFDFGFDDFFDFGGIDFGNTQPASGGLFGFPDFNFNSATPGFNPDTVSPNVGGGFGFDDFFDFGGAPVKPVQGPFELPPVQNNFPVFDQDFGFLHENDIATAPGFEDFGFDFPDLSFLDSDDDDDDFFNFF